MGGYAPFSPEGDHSAEIRRLDDAIKDNNKTIRQYQEAIKSEEREMDLSKMTAAQLGRRLKELKKELSNTSKATNIGRYRELEAQIRRVDKAYANATKSTRGFLASFFSLDKMSTTIKVFLWKLAWLSLSM